MFKRTSYAALMGAVATLALSLPGSATAATVYTYTGDAPTSFVITLTTSLSGAALHNLGAGTDITGSSTFTISGPLTPPPQDQLGFTVADNSLSAQAVKIGTDALGNITSWNIFASLFASYPAVAGENPLDFFCGYSVSSSSGG